MLETGDDVWQAGNLATRHVSHAALFPVAGPHLVGDVIQSFSRAASVVVWPLGKIQLFAALVDLADKPPGHGGDLDVPRPNCDKKS